MDNRGLFGVLFLSASFWLPFPSFGVILLDLGAVYLPTNPFPAMGDSSGTNTWERERERERDEPGLAWLLLNVGTGPGEGDKREIIIQPVEA